MLNDNKNSICYPSVCASVPENTTGRERGEQQQQQRQKRVDNVNPPQKKNFPALYMAWLNINIGILCANMFSSSAWLLSFPELGWMGITQTRGFRNYSEL
jgi:hypothetical protein